MRLYIHADQQDTIPCFAHQNLVSQLGKWSQSFGPHCRCLSKPQQDVPPSCRREILEPVIQWIVFSIATVPVARIQNVWNVQMARKLDS